MRPWKSKAYRGYPAAKKQSRHDVVHLKKPALQSMSISQAKISSLLSLASYQGEETAWKVETYLSVTISRTAPNLLVWFNALAAIPSTASNKQDTPYNSVQALG
jgi:hypothetical protein